MELIIIILMVLIAKSNSAYIEHEVTTDSFTQCDRKIKQIEREDDAILSENGPKRLYSTWFSKECEATSGSEYIIRKYTFFKNDTALLVRYYYIDESCSIPTYSVTIAGSIKLLGPSIIVSGATQTKFDVNAVYITALSRKIAKKFGQKLNATCGPQPKWRIYSPQLIYENLQESSDSSLFNGPRYNSLQDQSSMNKLANAKCLEIFGIEFSELSMLRVQRRPYGQKTDTDHSFDGTHVELLLANPLPYTYSQSNQNATFLQSTVLLRADTTKDCVICKSISQSTEYSPPVIHEEVILPPYIGGSWLSDRCESCKGGIWTKKQLHIHSGDKLWTARWDYYNDPQCSKSLYSVSAAGSYVLRIGRNRRHAESNKPALPNYFRTVDISTISLFKRSIATSIVPNDVYTSDQTNASDKSNNTKNRYVLNIQTNGQSKEIPKSFVYSKNVIQDKISDSNKVIRTTKRSLTDNNYQQSDQFMGQTRLKAMMRGNQEYETSTKRSVTPKKFSMMELDLHAVESKLIPENEVISIYCGVNETGIVLTSWPRNCVPQTVESPSTLELKIKLTADWNGQYILHLGLRDDNIWRNPLRQCARMPLYNPVLKARLKQSVSHSYGFLSSASVFRFFNLFLLSQLLLLCYIVR